VPTAACPPASRKWVLAATILASSMAFIDGTVVNVALPALQTSLDASLVDVQWVVEAYSLWLSSLLLAGGALGDRFGRRLVFVAGVVLFAAASVVCGLAGGIRMLVFARAGQGIGAALLVPGSLAILSAAFPAAERGRAIGTWSGFTAITTALGPVFGGWLIDHLSWRWAFFVNAPLAVAVIAISVRHLPESRGDAKGPVDWLGAALVTVGLGGLVYGLVESSERGWSDTGVRAALGGGAVALAAFVVVELKSRYPMVPPRLFRSREFTGANLLTLLLYAALSAVFFFVPMGLIQVHGYSAAAAGASMTPVILLMFALSRWSGGLHSRIGPRIPLVVGPLVVAAGFALFLRAEIGMSYWAGVFPAMVVLGLGLALTVAPLTTTVMESVDDAHAGVASGVNNAVSRVAGLLAIAILSIVMLTAFGSRLDRELPAARLAPATKASIDGQRTRLAAIELPPTTGADERARARLAISRAFVDGFRRVMLVSAALSVLASGAALACIRGSKSKGQAA
jgi:EmrB/QacA subfamily drug resistance transporter